MLLTTSCDREIGPVAPPDGSAVEPGELAPDQSSVAEEGALEFPKIGRAIPALQRFGPVAVPLRGLGARLQRGCERRGEV